MTDEAGEQNERSAEARAAMLGWTKPRMTWRAWPQLTPSVDPGLRMMDPARARLLRERIPEPSGDTWNVARSLLGWSATRWIHDGWNEGGDADALELLDRSTAGERFRCVEFAVLLAGALGAVGIPARGVALRRAGYERPEPGMGHVVLEAWIDSLARWVLLDAQNSAWWEIDGEPANALELCGLHRSDAVPASFVGLEGAADDADMWWTYFDTASVGHNKLAFDNAIPVTFQQFGWVSFRRVLSVDDHDLAYPSFHGIEAAMVAGDTPVAQLTSCHPYATGIAIDGVLHRGATATLELATTIGDHAAQFEVVTPRGAFRAGELAWSVAAPLEPAD